MINIYRCNICGNIAVKLHDSGVNMSCCGQEMVKLSCGVTDASTEKHVPVLERDGQKVTVKVGSVLHPMEENHYIEWIILEKNNGYDVKFLKPGEEPIANFVINEEDEIIAVYEYCNIHGLWKYEM